ncbi:flagellar motor protein MotD [Silanimonas sp.]|jgi:chemotaxis protein MotB|uniref:flagellar motor protein MotD n=1 Tax=Silanimonas sp. TaxID=1929290 RepID=UPI0022C7EBC4|nr:flagellar motor protein MotD [Silanimonas sp.]MCZ8115600.1 flagellar motor protein MotD [Silanimonas sp.]
MARHARHEEHVNHEAWAIPYGDLVTLLLAFFVVMYAISTLNEGKYRVMSDSLNAAFDGVPRSIAPIQIGQPTEASSIAPPQPFENDSGSPSVVNLSERVRADAAITPIELMQLEQQQAQADIQLDAIQRQVERALGPLIMSDQVTVTREGLWLEVNIRSDVLFASGSAALSTPARDAIDQLATVLRELPNELRVEGHTDNQPIASALFPSNWELSGARAASVIRLLEGRGVDPRRMAAIGFGDKRPVADNATPAGRSTNRRVMLVILATSPGTTSDAAARPPNQVSPPPAVEGGAATPTEAARPPAPVSVPQALSEDVP